MSNPILSFVARRRMRSIRTPLMLTLYALVLALIAYVAVYSPFLSPLLTISSMQGGVVGYIFMVIFQFALLVLVAPAMTAGCISGERERQTMDLLLVTNTGTTSLILGKLLESFGFLSLMILCSTPVLSLVLLTGGATMAQVLVSVLFLLITALSALCVGLFCSTLFHRTMTSTVFSYLFVFGIGIVTLLPIWYDVRRIGEIYDSINLAGATLTKIDYLPLTFTMNPGLGLFSLLQSQTGLFPSDYLYSVSYTLANTFWLLPFDEYLRSNMIFMIASDMLLITLSVLCVRLDRRGGHVRRLRGKR